MPGHGARARLEPADPVRITPFTVTEIRMLRDRLAEGVEGADLACPACGATLAVRRVRAGPEVPYVRSRLRVHCPGCGRSGAIDRRAGPSG